MIDSTVALVTSPSNRDIYRIGIGVDFVHMIMALTHPTDTVKATNVPNTNADKNTK